MEVADGYLRTHPGLCFPHLANGVPPGSLPVMEQITREIVSLPMYPELTSDQLQRVVNAATTATDEV